VGNGKFGDRKHLDDVGLKGTADILKIDILDPFFDDLLGCVIDENIQMAKSPYVSLDELLAI